MDDFENLIKSIESKHGNSKSLTDPDWTQVGTWADYVPKEIRKVWTDIPHETRLLLYYMAFEAYRKGLSK